MSVAKVYGMALEKVWSGLIDVTTDTLTVSLHDTSYIPDQGSDGFFTLPGEITGTGYTSGGNDLVGVALTYDAATATVKLDCDNPIWLGATLTGIRYAVFRKNTGSDATSPLLAYMDFLSDQSCTATAFSIVIPGTGLLQDSAA
jgi:hypothetical protein